jgi:hypothetical protein
VGLLCCVSYGGSNDGALSPADEQCAASFLLEVLGVLWCCLCAFELFAFAEPRIECGGGLGSRWEALVCVIVVLQNWQPHNLWCAAQLVYC